MPRTEHLYAQLDRARNRLDAIEKAEGDAQDAIRAAVDALAKAIKANAKDARYTVERIEEELADFTLNARADLEREISQHELALSELEHADVRRSSPVTL